MKCIVLFTLLSTLLSNVLGFAPVHKTCVKQPMKVNTNTLQRNTPGAQMPVTIQNQRHSVAQVQTMSLFGLGGPEIAIILIAAAFVLGPQKLAELGKDAGKIAGELKEVPKEFQKGLAEGEQLAQEAKKDIVGGGEIADAKKEE